MEVVWLANHNAHTYFGLQVLGQLPPDLRELCTEDLPVFHLGLYGPDPLIFSLWTKKSLIVSTSGGGRSLCLT